MQKNILNSLKEQRIAGRTIRLNWQEWQEYCLEHGLDARKTCENGHDLGGGDSYEVVCYDMPEEG